MTTLEKIRAEIEQIKPWDYPCDKRTPEHIRDMALDIIDKYAEQDKLMIIEANVNGYTQGLKDASNAEQEPCADAAKTIQELMLENEELSKDLDEALKEIDEYEQGLEQEPCDDAISRQAVKEQIKGWLNYELRDMTNPLHYLEKRINELPSVRPLEQTGHWIRISPAEIYECSECGQNVMTSDICAYEFCHGCGARMVEPQESEDKG